MTFFSPVTTLFMSPLGNDRRSWGGRLTGCLQAYLGDTIGLVSDHYDKANIAIK